MGSIPVESILFVLGNIYYVSLNDTFFFFLLIINIYIYIVERMRNFIRFKKSKLLYSDIFGNGYMSYKLNDNFSLIYTFLWKFNNSFLKEVSNFYKKIRKGKRKHYKLVEKRIRNWKLGQRFSSFILLRVFMTFYYNVKKHQFRKYFVKANRQRGFFVDNFLFLLEMRIDMFLFRSFPCLSLGFIRQFILHTGIFVNDALVRRISFNVRHNDIISFFGNIVSHGKFLEYKDNQKFVKHIKKKENKSIMHSGQYLRNFNCRRKIKSDTSVPIKEYIKSFFIKRRKLRKPFAFIRPHYSIINYNKFFLRVNCPNKIGFSSKIYYPFGLNLKNLYSIAFEKLK